MDTKRLLTSMLFAGVLMLGISYFYKPGGGAPAATKVPYSIYSAKLPDLSKPETQALLGSDREEGAVEELIPLGDPLKDKVSITINTRTAGIERVQMNVHDFAATPARKEPLTLFKAVDGLPRPFATMGVHVWLDGGTSPLRGKELTFGFVRNEDLATHDVTFRLANADPARGAVDSAAAVEASNRTWLYDRQYIWKKTNVTATQVDLTMTLKGNGQTFLEVVKTFRIDPVSYEVLISHQVTNKFDVPLKVAIDQLGAGDLPHDDVQSDDRFMSAMGYDSTNKTLDEKRFHITHVELEKFTAGTRGVGQFHDFAANPTLWIASSNRFFVAIIRPLDETPPGRATSDLFTGKKLTQTHHVLSADVDVMQYATKPIENLGIIRLTGATLDLPAKGQLIEPLSVYFGPKMREILEGKIDAPENSEAYNHAVYAYDKAIRYTDNACWIYSLCAFDPVVKIFLYLLDFFKNYLAFGNYGVAIMILVIVVRACLHPLTRASQISMAKMGKKMRDVSPQLEAVKRKYASDSAKDKQKRNEEMMRIYRENNVNPAGGILGCLPMVVQMPIWAALWSGLRADIDLRHASFIPGWINDLSSPDTLFPATTAIGHPIFVVPFVGFEIYGFNLLPLLLAVVFFFQMKVTSASQPKPADEQQAQMQKISQYMIFLFPLFLYNAPSGLNLYIFASTMGGLIDTWLVRKTLKKQGILPQSAKALPTHEEKESQTVEVRRADKGAK